MVARTGGLAAFCAAAGVVLSVLRAFAAPASAAAPGSARVASATPAGAAHAAIRPVLYSLVAAGGGSADFKTLVLLSAVAGANVNAELAAITKQFGARPVKEFITTVDFTINDALRRLSAVGAKLPGAAAEPVAPRALAAALYAAGRDRRHGDFRTAALFDALFSPVERVRIERDAGVALGPAAIPNAAHVWERFMRDMKTAYVL